MIQNILTVILVFGRSLQGLTMMMLIKLFCRSLFCGRSCFARCSLLLWSSLGSSLLGRGSLGSSLGNLLHSGSVGHLLDSWGNRGLFSIGHFECLLLVVVVDCVE